MTENLFERVYPMALRIAQVRCRYVTTSCVLMKAEREDLEQEALFECWRKLGYFDPARASLQTFIGRIIDNKLISLIRARAATKRGAAAQHDCIDVAHTKHALAGRSFLDDLDVRRTIATLSQADQQTALLLVDHSPTEASRILRTSRSTVYLSINRIQQAFRDAGLGPGRNAR